MLQGEASMFDKVSEEGRKLDRLNDIFIVREILNWDTYMGKTNYEYRRYNFSNIEKTEQHIDLLKGPPGLMQITIFSYDLPSKLMTT